MNTLCVFLLFTYILPNIDGGAEKCTSRGYFGTDCTYWCHCRQHEHCDLVTGRCLNQECTNTYFGPSCQQAANGACMIGNFGSNCQYLCHCGDRRTVCDQMIGKCVDTESCSSGYHGDNCQIANVALGKYAYQSSDYSYVNIAGLAVDGDQDPEFDENRSNPKCSHTNSSQADNWWYVDLRKVYPIQRIRIYNRDGPSQNRLSGFQVKVGERRTAYEVCYTDQMSAVPPLVIDVRCDRIIKGRYVRINTRHSDQILTLCEVQVFVCTDYWYGAYCNYTCNCDDVNEVCDKHTGECPISGCRQDYGGIDCNECDLDNYGQKCYNSCSSHCNAVTPGDRVCHVKHGACTAECQSGYLPPLCNGECEWGYYGDCATPCSEHCGPILMHGRACNPLTGHCTNTTSCRKGFQGPRCDKGCDAGKYGENCRERCSMFCSRDKCDAVTGKCEEGCLPGYTGPWCLKKCKAPRHFGLNCVRSCDFCAESPGFGRVCDHMTGRCFVGCTSGYRGDMCDKECYSTTYGEGCQNHCSDQCITVFPLERVCNHVTGVCTSCKPGYKGTDCDQRCTERSFGVNCGEACNCRRTDEVCDQVTGACTSGCAIGYQGNDCKTVLESNTADVGKIAGIVIGCILGIALIATLVVIYRLRRKMSKTTTATSTTTQASHGPDGHTYQDLAHKLDTEEHQEMQETTGDAADTVIEYEGAEYCEIAETTTKDRGQHGNDIYENSDSVYLTPIHTTI